jgi:hypothetical protein
VVPRLRPLRYAPDQRARPIEKGVDVQLAVSALEWTLTGRCDVAVIFSQDTDLLPAVEAIARLRGPAAVETASWGRRVLRPKAAVRNHALSRTVFDRVETPINYARRPAR